MFATSNLFGLSDINLICLCIDQAHQATCTNSFTFSSLSHKYLYSKQVYQHVTPCQRSGIERNIGPVRLPKSDHATDIDADNYDKDRLTLLWNDTVSRKYLDVKQLQVFCRCLEYSSAGFQLLCMTSSSSSSLWYLLWPWRPKREMHFLVQSGLRWMESRNWRSVAACWCLRLHLTAAAKSCAASRHSNN